MSSTFVCWREPGRPALLTEEGTVLTYGRLRAIVSAFARRLPSRQLMFLVGQSDVNTIIAYLACLEARAVPLLLSSQLSLESYAQLYRAYRPAYVFVSTGYPNVCDSSETLAELGEYALLRNTKAVGPKLHRDLAVLLATSGSTGSPKLVRLSLNNIHANADSICTFLDIRQDDRAITSLPFNYSYGLSVINSHLYAGASISLTTRSLLDAVFWKQVKSQNVTSIAGVPYSYEILLRLGFDRMDLPSLKTLTQAGGRLDPKRIRQVHQIAMSKGLRLFVMYGQTEATARIAYISPTTLEEKLGSIGQAIPGGRLWLEDELGQVIDSPGVIGELIYSGPNVALGYAQTGVDLMRGDDWHGVLRTGDLARQDADRYFYIEGRKRRFIKIFGVRVSLDAVENWFTQRGMIAAAFGPDDHLCVTVESVQEDDLQTRKLSLAADFTIHPSALTLNAVAALPRLASGKVDYQTLRNAK